MAPWPIFLLENFLKFKAHIIHSGKMSFNILGVSCFYHDSACCLVQDGTITAAAQEERFTRKKHDPRFPVNAMNYCLEQARLEENQIDCVAFYEKPPLALDRIVNGFLSGGGQKAFDRLMKLAGPWGVEKLDVERSIKERLANFRGDVVFSQHHLSHAASAFYPSPFDDSAILTIDGVGEWATAGMYKGSGATIEPIKEMRYPHSLGLFYSAMTYFAGFKVNSGEYKLMGLAPYGEPVYYELLKDNVIDVKEDGSIHLNLDYFDYIAGDRMTSEKMNSLFGSGPRLPETNITRREMDIAATAQKITEETVLKMARNLKKETSSRNLCMAGGVALNCVANGKLYKSGVFEDMWIQPASGDAGGALGAALGAWHIYYKKSRARTPGRDGMNGSFLGPSYSNDEIMDFLDLYGLPYEQVAEEDLPDRVADIIAGGSVLGLFRGRMEYGPRALGSRSIIADPRVADMQTRLNLKIKFRESFRPFAPMVLQERASEWFDMDCGSPYMLLVCKVKEDKRIKYTDPGGDDLMSRLAPPRSSIPSVTHLDYSARVQTVDDETNRFMSDTLRAFEKKTGVPIIINTSFNVRGEPMVLTPFDAYRCMMRTQMDYLLMENVLVKREEQPGWEESEAWKDEFALD